MNDIADHGVRFGRIAAMAVERRDALIITQAYGFLYLRATQGKSSKKLQQDAQLPLAQETVRDLLWLHISKNAPFGRHYSRLGSDG